MKSIKKLCLFLMLVCTFVLVIPLNTYATDSEDYYIVNEKTGKYHLPSCSYLPASSNSYTLSRSRVSKYPGLSPCGHCKPDQAQNEQYEGYVESNQPSSQTHSPFVEFFISAGKIATNILCALLAIGLLGFAVILGWCIGDSEDKYDWKSLGILGCIGVVFTSGGYIFSMRKNSVFDAPPSFWCFIISFYVVSLLLILIWYLKNKSKI